MAKELSNPQTDILHFIEQYIAREKCPPTNREIGEAVGIHSTGHVDHHLTMLEKKGHIIRERRKSRGIRLTRAERTGLPVAGTIAAGVPLEINPDNPDAEMIDLSTDTREKTYVLLVRGESMIGDHIRDGDFVLIDPDAGYHDGDIVVATCNAGGEHGSATLKRIFREHDRVCLQPSNETMQPIYVARDEWDRDWQVQGKMVAVYRRCN